MTLLEKMISSAILSILAATASFSWVGFVSAQNVKVAGSTLNTAVSSAKSDALKKKCQPEFELWNFPNESICMLDMMAAEVTTGNSPRVLQLNVLRKLAWEKYNSTVNYAVVEQWLNSTSTPLVNLNSSVQLVSEVATRQLSTDLSSVLSLALHAQKSEKTVTGNALNALDLLDVSGMVPKATKAVPKIKYMGCFASNGVISVQTAAGLTTFNPAMLPAGTVVTLKVTACPAVPVK